METIFEIEMIMNRSDAINFIPVVLGFIGEIIGVFLIFISGTINLLGVGTVVISFFIMIFGVNRLSKIKVGDTTLLKKYTSAPKYWESYTTHFTSKCLAVAYSFLFSFIFFLMTAISILFSQLLAPGDLIGNYFYKNLSSFLNILMATVYFPAGLALTFLARSFRKKWKLPWSVILPILFARRGVFPDDEKFYQDVNREFGKETKH